MFDIFKRNEDYEHGSQRLRDKAALEHVKSSSFFFYF